MRVVVVCLVIATAASSLTMMSRRSAVSVVSLGVPTISRANDERIATQELVKAIDRGAPTEEVEACIAKLVPLSTSTSVDGCWKLLWSARTRNFSPLLELPKPIRPDSTQFFEDGRIENSLTRGVLGGSRLVLTAGFDDPLILPPFRFDVRVLDRSIRLVDAGSDADFRRTQARSQEEQRAPRNRYVQLYLGKDIRVSKVVEGDPVILGATFVHRRLATNDQCLPRDSLHNPVR
ncbi:hypothetical protein CTAYLR_010105 [Chrysophaeum taylorii]|uniref:Plastid lipid-associated protein/fibrillin conserved domain-containing protein n=1 Tax=Chrysophaeum taylorii TaxID=2483200 RepID=A0AAD7XEQ3_9STRA|nr:hypothetical protein CTAYLR_010105 [Chrysophaeum taylorii]